MKDNLFDNKSYNYLIILSYIIVSYLFSLWTELLDRHAGNKFTVQYLLFLILYIFFSIAVFVILYYSNIITTIIISIWNFLSIPSIIFMADYSFKFTPNNHLYITTRVIVLCIRILILFWSIYRLYRLNQVNTKKN